MNRNLRPRPRWGLVFAALCLGAMATVPQTGGATPLPGENGRIVLTSEQNLGSQKAELFLLPVPGSTGGGTLSPPITASPTLRHRHPTWSPDRTKIAYARGPSAGPFDIFVQDLTQPLSATNPKDLTPNAPASSEDRPAWSPDGTHIAFEKDQGTPASRDIFVASAANGSGQTNITSTAGAIEGAPTWDPSGSTIYYEKGDAQIGRPTWTSSSGPSPTPMESPPPAGRPSPWRRQRAPRDPARDLA